MKNLLLSIVLVFAFGVAYAQTAEKSAKSAKSTGSDQQALIDKEKSMWEAWKNKDMKPFHADVADDSVNLDSSSGTWIGKEEMIKGMTDHPCEVKSYSLSDEKVTPIDKDAAILTYVANQDATCNGQKVPDKVYASSVWAKRGGKWVGVSHQETPAMPAATSSEKKE
jgi:ketosteroid isomerase-like protein